MVSSGVNRPATKTGRGKIAVLCGLAMVLAAMCFRMFKPNLEPSVAAAPAPVAASPAPTAGAAAAPSVRHAIAWPDAAARDPFHSTKVYPPPAPRVETPKVAATAPAPQPIPTVNVAALARETIRLKGTVQQGGRAVAMVNGRLFRVGESIGGFQVVEIGKRSIVVEQAGTRVVIDPE